MKKNKNIMLFSHKSDIDGMGAVILTKLAFENVNYCLCESYELKQNIQTYEKEMLAADYIFVCDLPLKFDDLVLLSNEKWKRKVFAFDHHESSNKDYLINFDFATVMIEDKGNLCSGTSLFYQFLKNQKLINSFPKLDNFVELTRRYDTWEWKTKYADEMPHKLSLLFDSIGIEGYISMILNDLLSNQQESFEFTEIENLIIQSKITQVSEKIKKYSQNIFKREIFGKKAGLLFIDYEYRNDLAEYIRQNNYNIDFVMLITLDKGTISLRSINYNVDVREIAEYYGGGGHVHSASFSIVQTKQEEIINQLITLNE